MRYASDKKPKPLHCILIVLKTIPFEWNKKPHKNCIFTKYF